MRPLLVALALLVPLFGEHIRLGKHQLTVVKSPYAEYDEKGIALKFYLDKKLLPDLSTILEEHSGACNDRYTTLGAYRIVGDRLRIYEKFLHKRRLIALVRSTYGIEGNRTVLYEKVIFAPMQNESYEKVLLTGDLNATLKRFVAMQERLYKGKFLVGKEAKALIEEATDAFLQADALRWGK